jgi:hypothetical protein
MYNRSAWYSKFGLTTYNQCPRKYKYEVVNKANRGKYDENKYFSFDKSIHLTMAALNNMEAGEFSSLNSISIDKYIQENWIELGYTSLYEERQFKKKAENIIMEYIRNPRDIGLNNIIINKFVEVRLSTNFRIRAKIDKVYETYDRKIEIIDYKTGNLIDKSTNFLKNVQLPLYLTIVQRKYNINVDLISYYYLNHSRKLTYVVKEHDINNAEFIIAEYINQMRNDKKFGCRPNPYCEKFCDFYKECKGIRSNNL